MELSPREEDTLRHMLGVNDPYKRDPKPYRNHYVAGSEDVPRLERLASLGLVVKRPTRLTEDPLYVATEAGIQVDGVWPVGELCHLPYFHVVPKTRFQRILA